MTKQEQLKNLFCETRYLTAKEIRAAGIPSQTITNLCRCGKIERVAYGVYALAGNAASETDDLELLAKLVPAGVICLVSALRFHKLTDENPHEVSMAVLHGSYTPKFAYPPVCYFTFSGKAFSSGIKIHTTNGVDLKVYSIEKTIADCFKYRNKIGLDVAIAALREAVSQNRIDYNALWDAAKICRVSKIIRPYMEAVQ